MQSADLRERLLHALEALEKAQPPSLEAAFQFIAVYLPGLPPVHDEELGSRFRHTFGVIQDSKDRQQVRDSLVTKRTQQERRDGVPAVRPEGLKRGGRVVTP